jgi:hypothetical protein
MVHRKSSSASVGGQKPPREDLQDGEGMGRRAETTMHGRGTSSNGSGPGDSAGGSCGDASQRLDAARSELLRSKQAELDAIEDKHDDLVRFLSSLFPHTLGGGCGDSSDAFYLIFLRTM